MSSGKGETRARAVEVPARPDVEYRPCHAHALSMTMSSWGAVPRLACSPIASAAVPATRVLLLEAGTGNLSTSRRLLGRFTSWFDPNARWQYETVPQRR